MIFRILLLVDPVAVLLLLHCSYYDCIGMKE